MSRNLLTKFIFIVLLVAWSFYEIYPPTGRGLLEEFRTRAVQRDAAFTNILTELNSLQSTNAGRDYNNLVAAIGTNDISRYFPFFDTKSELNPNRYVLNRLQREASGKIKLGLDLQGGTSFLVGVELNKATSGDTNAVASGTNAISVAEAQERGQRILSQAVEVLRKRVDKFGVAEPIIQPQGSDRILIQLPGLSESDKEEARTRIQQAAYLEFRMVHEDSDKYLQQGMSEPGYQWMKTKTRGSDGKDEVHAYLVRNRAEMTGKYIKSAMVSRNPMSNQPEIEFTLTSAGADLFAKITHDNIGRQLGIVLDGSLMSAPVIQGEIPAGRGQITGTFDLQEAQQIASALENPLEAPVHILESNDVSPSLGQDSITSGMRAALYGVAAVSVFMLVYYLLGGLVANIALMLNIIILLGVMCAVGTTLTLPGIAGVVLTIGMAVDANVLIFERIREEQAAGKSLRGALSAGYDKAFGTIFDSNLTTLISSVILIFMGTGPVKGFGVTLTIGVTVSMFTALVVTRLIFDFMVQRGWLKTSLTMWQFPFLHNTKFNFMKYALPAFIASWLLIVIGNGWGIYREVGARHHNHSVKTILGVDFAGGDEQTYSFAQDPGQDKIRAVIDKLDVGDPTIQTTSNPVTKTQELRITTAFGSADKVTSALQQAFPEAKLVRASLQNVGPIIGQEITRVAILASLLAMFGILIYVAFRYEFSFAVGAVIAIIHDIFMTMGWFFLTDRQLSAPIVAAILTIIGFSINDTIVIFDRIREDLKLGVRGTFREVMNQALNQTLSRTIITSGTVFLATLSLYIFGGGVINDFAFTFLVGILTGTYSSIYIASAIVLWWHKGHRPNIGSPVNAATSAVVASAKA
ncbi:MAG TPA: protein translocase subunit SecD [Dongiaceae bacterium]|jgi:SecD/SecF fusion protein|nr:protein translocase subunit SecD [Dongiaceae bacterium]